MNFLQHLWLLVPAYLVILLLLPWFMVATVRAPCKFRPHFMPLEQVRQQGNAAFHQALDDLQALGFTIVDAGVMEILRNQIALAVSFEHAHLPYRVTVQLNQVGSQQQVMTEFQQAYANRHWLILNNSKDVTMPVPAKVCMYQLPGAVNLKEMDQAFQKLCERHPAAEPLNLQGKAGSDAAIDLLNRVLYHWCKAGYFSMRCEQGYRRMSIGFAYRVAWLNNWPLKPFFLHAAKRKTRAALH